MNALAAIRAVTGNTWPTLAILGANGEGASRVAACVGYLLTAHAAALFTEGERGLSLREITAAFHIIEASTTGVVGAANRCA